jgi:hypothetical protein
LWLGMRVADSDMPLLPTCPWVRNSAKGMN